ncbi:mannosylglycerate hydrolase [Abditibacteriota bacterium]|nr:mannosylglycerate hydrolase [Abditibacteriota bacterium]
MSSRKTDLGGTLVTRRSFLRNALIVTTGSTALVKFGAKGAFAQAVSAAGELAKPTLYLVATAHDDTQWNWTVQDTIREYIPNTMRPNWELMEKYPAYNFNYEATIHYGWFKEYHPADWKELQDWVAKDRWKLSGSWVNAVDVNIPSPESLFRQALYGQAFFRREFGKVSRDIYLPDCFGFPYSLPTIAHHSGLNSFSSQKFDGWGGYFPAPFSVGRWEGVDGSQVVASLRPKGYGTKLRSDVSNDRNFTNDFTNAGNQPVNMRYFGTGDQGGTPGEESVSWLQKSVENKNGIAKVVNTSADQIARDLTPAQIAALPVYKGELLMTAHGVGCYSSQAIMKKWNRQNELLGDAAERAALGAQWLGGAPYPHEVLNAAWLRFLFHQFHDDLTGTCIPQAYTFSWNDELLSLNQFAQVVTTSVGALARSLDTRVEGVPLAIYNPLDQARRDCVEATVTLPATAPFVRVFDAATKREVPSQVLSQNGREFKIVFIAAAPSVGVQIYDVRPSQMKCALTTTLKVSPNSLENARLQVKLTPNGDVSSVFDKAANRELLGDTATLEHFDDFSGFWPAWEIMWDVVGKPPAGTLNEKTQIKVLENGPARVSIEVRRSLGDSVWVQHVRLSEGGDWLEMHNDVDWRSPGKLVKAAFPMAASNPKATFDLGLGTIERPNANPKLYEVPAQNWADLSAPDGSSGMAVLTATKYGFDKPNDSTLRLTLLRTPNGDNYPHSRTGDIGHHHFAYAFAPHVGDWRTGDIQGRAARFNQPLRAFQTAEHTGRGQSLSLLRVSTRQVGVRGLKRAEDSDEWVVRLHELHGKAVTGARIVFGAPVVSVREINAAEEVVGPYKSQNGALVVDMKPYQPRSFAVRLAPAPVTHRVKAPQGQTVKLPFNLNGVSTNANLNAGNFDGKGESFAGELWPGTLERNGLHFELGKIGAPNFVECRGQTIKLPTGNFSRAVLLATSINGDQSGDFVVHAPGLAKPQRVRIADWVQHVGQWDSRLTNPSQGTGGGQLVKEIVNKRVKNIERMKPAYVKRDQVAWVGTHRHYTGGDRIYLFTYLFQVGLDVPRGATQVTLPNNPNIRIAALTLAHDTFEDTKSAGLIIEPQVSDASLPKVPQRQVGNKRVFGPTPVQQFDGKTGITHDEDALFALPLRDSDPWTINFFVYMDQAPLDHTLIAGFGDASDQNGTQRYLGRVGGGIQFWGSHVDIDSGVPFDIARWQMLTATFDGKMVAIYKNGEAIKAAPAVLSEAGPEVKLAPKDTWDKDNRFTGRIAGLGIWNYPLTPASIHDLLKDMPMG